MTCAEICICVFVHSADLWFLHLENNLRCRFAHFVHDGFLHICRFAHLHICTFAESLRTCAKCFLTCASLWKCFENVREHVNLFFFTVFHRICKFEQNFVKMSKKSKFPKMSRKCPKKAHVFLSGTRVVPGPTRLTTQGGKSRQNMH